MLSIAACMACGNNVVKTFNSGKDVFEIWTHFRDIGYDRRTLLFILYDNNAYVHAFKVL